MTVTSDTEQDQFLRDVLEGLSNIPKSVNSKYFYDKFGSDLFNQITELEEYYPTRTEISILNTYGPQIAKEIGRQTVLLEYGSGSLKKMKILLNFLEDVSALCPIDIAEGELQVASSKIKALFPKIIVNPIIGDFTKDINVDLSMWPDNRRVGVFFGSTIGNFTPKNIVSCLNVIAKTLGRDGMLLIGVDLKKEDKILTGAYNDQRGVTARFNKNLLVRINRELGANFDLNKFRHRAFYNKNEGRIEMHLESLTAHNVNICGRDFFFSASESIHTESSYKFSITDFQALAEKAGFSPVNFWTDQRQLYSLHLLVL